MSRYPLAFINACVAAAQSFRVERDYPDGLVIVFDFEAVGWINELRDPSGWEPGVLAVATDGEIHEARGGNVQEGAQRWERVEAEEAHS